MCTAAHEACEGLEVLGTQSNIGNPLYALRLTRLRVIKGLEHYGPPETAISLGVAGSWTVTPQVNVSPRGKDAVYMGNN